MYEVSQETIQKHAEHFWEVGALIEELPAGPEKAALKARYHRWHVVMNADLSAAGVQPLSGGTNKDNNP